MNHKLFLFPFIFLICSTAFPQDNIGDYIILDALRPLKPNEVFQISERMILQDGNDYRYIVNIVNNNHAEKIMELKNIRWLIPYDNQKTILLYGRKYYNEKYKGEPLFIIDGVEGKIEYLDNFWHGFFLAEDGIIISKTYYQQGQLTDDLFVYDIIRREVICVYDANAYLMSKLDNITNREYYEIAFPDYYNAKVKATNGRIKVYFDHRGEDGPGSFYTYLNIQDTSNIYIE